MKEREKKKRVASGKPDRYLVQAVGKKRPIVE